MKYISVILFFSLIAGGACKKTTINPGPKLVFGSSCSQCYIYYKSFYSINGIGLYQDTNHYKSGDIHCTSAITDTAKYVMARSLLSHFPQYLRNGSGDKLLCPGCTYGPMFPIYLEYTNEQNHTVKWDINPDTSFLPVSIRAYVQQVYTVLGKL